MTILEPAPGPENVRRVADGGADYCLTSVAHLLSARARYGSLPARYVAVVVRHSPIAGIVPVGSDATAPADLAGLRVGGPADGRLLAEYRTALAARGVARPPVVPIDYGDAPAALGRGEIDVVPDFADLVPRVRRQSGVDVRAVRVGLPVYSSGLVAADRKPREQVERMRAAIAAALTHQRRNPSAGLGALRRRYPTVDPGDAVEGWTLAVPTIFTGEQPGSMTAETWEASLRHYGRTLDLPAPALEDVVRADFTTMPSPAA